MRSGPWLRLQTGAVLGGARGIRTWLTWGTWTVSGPASPSRGRALLPFKLKKQRDTQMTDHQDTTNTPSRPSQDPSGLSMASTAVPARVSSMHSGTAGLGFTDEGLNALAAAAASPRSGWVQRVGLAVILPVVVTVFAHCAERCGAGKWHVEFKGASGSVTLYGSPRSPSPMTASPWVNVSTVSTPASSQ